MLLPVACFGGDDVGDAAAGVGDVAGVAGMTLASRARNELGAQTGTLALARCGPGALAMLEATQTRRSPKQRK